MTPRYRNKWVAGPATALLLVCVAAAADWNDSVRACVQRKDFACARNLVQAQLRDHPGDVEALTWDARLHAWSGEWDAAASGYNDALRLAPQDSDILLGLADVQIWQGKFNAALQTLDRAAAAHAAPADVLPRRGNALLGLQRRAEAEQAYEAALRINAADQVSRQRLQGMRAESDVRRHELRVGSDADTFSFAGPANAASFSLRSDWNRRWSTRFAATSYWRFGQTAQLGNAEVTLHVTDRTWLTAGGQMGNAQQIVPEHGNSTELGHSFRLSAGPLKGIESYLQQRNYWYSGAQVSTFGTTQVFYLPNDWRWTLNVAAARTAGSVGEQWSPAGFTRLSFPLASVVRGNLLYAVGTEDFLLSDQIGHFSARTYGGGLRIQLTRFQDLSFNFAYQDRSRAQSQTSAGVSYGIRF